MFNRLVKYQEILVLSILLFLPQHTLADGNNYDSMAITAVRGTYMFSTGNVDNADLIFAKNFVRHEQQYLTPESNMEDISKLIESQRKIYKVEELLTEPLNTVVDTKNNTVAVRWSASVQRQPDAGGELPEQMKFEGVTISRFEKDKIAEQWVYYDSNLVLTLTRLRYKDYFESNTSK